MDDLAVSLKQEAQRLGFDLVGIAKASEAETFTYFREWLEKGYAGEMAYLNRHASARMHPSSIFPNVRSVVMTGMNYHVEPDAPDRNSLTGKVARYALGADYHEVLRDRLKHLLGWVQEQAPGAWGRAVVDTAPLLERDFARRAGLGWFGKNTMLLNKKLGSYLFLGALLLDIALPSDVPHEAAHCGTCTACLDACPTEAFPAPGVLDARRCLSYLTVELRGPVPEELRPHFKEWTFGCDICQEVCPWNRKAPIAKEAVFVPREDLLPLDLIEILSLTETEFKERFRGTALMRTKRSGLLRTAALILGNRGDATALPALERAREDPDPAIRDACTWAVNRLQKQKA
jgi:epoxyqueuosine reductase